ncbi:MAG: hypothetical protein NVS3B7_05810 [Candidatus Elarobacter sp.]
MKRFLTPAIAVTLGLAACTGSHESNVTPVPAVKLPAQHIRHLQSNERSPLTILGGAPRFTALIRLFDAPLIGATAANATFNAGIIGVDAIDTKGDSWQLVANATPRIVNLLALQTAPLDLGSGSLPAGTYPSLQLLLDPAKTSVTYNGVLYPARFVVSYHPWWDTTHTIEAVRVPLNITGIGSDTVQATLDFNVFQSADLRDGVVYLTPTVAGGIGQPTIAGTVVNNARLPVSNATVTATDSLGVVANTTVTAADGTYHLRGINAGGYTINVKNTFVTNAGVTVNAVGADAGAAPSVYVVVAPNGTVNVTPLID